MCKFHKYLGFYIPSKPVFEPFQSTSEIPATHRSTQSSSQSCSLLSLAVISWQWVSRSSHMWHKMHFLKSIWNLLIFHLPCSCVVRKVIKATHLTALNTLPRCPILHIPFCLCHPKWKSINLFILFGSLDSLKEARAASFYPSCARRGNWGSFAASVVRRGQTHHAWWGISEDMEIKWLDQACSRQRQLFLCISLRHP